uniref:NADH-ubiquinone oxidoreductase chain 6 n=1 Tax=Hydrolycus scomberoides TaxID=642551 RepID=F7UIP2_HYDSO|nr:NADH dehydrogenase subunit 6 [Hydrolycus scomberoides]BAK42106.1 NADH dehydrogenase subunit 6 [Hydrolycus scomberoides]
MARIFSLLLFGLVGGLVAVASNPAPYFAALGLVVAAGVGCGVLVGYGGAFLSLVLFLIYLGGMLVVFAYSAAMAAEPHPESWGDRSVVVHVLVYFLGVGAVAWLLREGWYEGSWGVVGDDFSLMGGDMGGVALLYSYGGGVLVVTGWVLLLTLFVVLELVRGQSRGVLRAV